METVEIWKQTLSAVKTHVSKPSYETWLKVTNVHAIENNTMFIEAPNEFAKDWLADRYEALYLRLFKRLLVILMNYRLSCKILQ
ncbi:DnaA N-terminal domain-containing protein [Geomicrobium sp. JCM 19038]|uniref:DnaA N-terminal domain-containing protein n=1 Tax=Geomicrobium sp. JCM 19038 TaxID=1460635 RepID=UPI00045F46A3|nr:chromosomal replication initiator protein DnaA [Geomicrobium sp. JCM 19038]